MTLKLKRVSEVRESNVGVYLWQLPSGNYLADTDHNVLNIPSRYGDIQRMAAIQKAAVACGYPDGKAVFVNTYRVTQDEYDEQMESLLNEEQYNV